MLLLSVNSVAQRGVLYKIKKIFCLIFSRISVISYTPFYVNVFFSSEYLRDLASTNTSLHNP